MMFYQRKHRKPAVLLLAIMAAIIAIPLVSAVNLTEGVAAHWAFNSTSGTSAADDVGNLTCTITGSPGWIAGKINNSLNLTTSSTYCSFTSYSPSSFCFWVNHVPGQDNTLLYGGSSDVLNLDGTGKIVIWDGAGRSPSPAVNLGNSTWTHSCFVWGGSGYSIYKNGVNESWVAMGHKLAFSSFGRSATAGIISAIDETTFYNRSITSDEVTAIYNNESAGVPYPYSSSPTNQSPVMVSVNLTNVSTTIKVTANATDADSNISGWMYQVYLNGTLNDTGNVSGTYTQGLAYNIVNISTFYSGNYIIGVRANDTTNLNSSWMNSSQISIGIATNGSGGTPSAGLFSPLYKFTFENAACQDDVTNTSLVCDTTNFGRTAASFPGMIGSYGAVTNSSGGGLLIPGIANSTNISFCTLWRIYDNTSVGPDDIFVYYTPSPNFAYHLHHMESNGASFDAVTYDGDNRFAKDVRTLNASHTYWLCVAAGDGVNTTLWVDGVRINTTTNNGWSTAACNNVLGSRNCVAYASDYRVEAEGGNGYLDEGHVWKDYYLTDDDVAFMYDNLQANLTALYNVTNGTGNGTGDPPDEEEPTSTSTGLTTTERGLLVMGLLAGLVGFAATVFLTRGVDFTSILAVVIAVILFAAVISAL